MLLVYPLELPVHAACMPASIDAISQALPAGVQLDRMHIWLAISPCAEVLMSVWQVVCMASVAAMERGRRILWASHFTHLQAPAGVADQGRQQTLEEACGIVPRPLRLQVLLNNSLMQASMLHALQSLTFGLV